MKVAVVYGGPSPEHEISILTGLQCERVLTRAGETVTSVYWSRNGDFHLVDNGLEARDFLNGVPSGAKPLELRVGATTGFFSPGRLRSTHLDVDAVLNACHGGPGESGTLNAIFETSGTPCTGGPAYAAQLGMDKLAFGALSAQLGLAAVPRVALTPDGPPPAFEAPYIVKPRFGGSSIGIQKVADLDTARALLKSSPHLRAGAVIEPYLEGAYDVNFSYVTDPDVAISQPERPARGDSHIFDFSQKYLQGGAGITSAAREFPAQMDPAHVAAAEECIRALLAAGNFRGIGRVDFLVKDDQILLNEINTIPGAMAFYLWPDRTESELLTSMIEGARKAPVPAIASSNETIEALRVAGGISQKLRTGH